EELADGDVVEVLDRAGVASHPPLPDGVRIAERDGHVWVTNFSDSPVSVDAPTDATWVIGDANVEAFDVGVVTGSVGDVTVTQR
ncbi:Beta-galactosidase C-terminal domain, partial [Natronoarchaeum mannanilyticum]|uniref:Beta-galactosidase C-terminal domain n=1 Tax=Natronoarchaeum mannanilyticum TaxID=926360 RepID=UPI0036205EFE